MKVILQRVSKAAVTVENEKIAEIDSGLLIFLGIVDDDNIDDVRWLSNKIVNCRIFSDEKGVMNKSVLELDGEILLISQFTLHASTKKGHRPSYNLAAKPDVAIPIYEKFIEQLENDFGKTIQTGKFGADMEVMLINDGPVTIIIDTKNK